MCLFIYSEFTAHLVGGRLVSYGNLLLSTGDFRTRTLSQKNSYLGKIILINKLNKDLGLFS